MEAPMCVGIFWTKALLVLGWQSHARQTKPVGAEGLICYFFSLAFVQYFSSLVVAGLSTNEQLSPLLQIGRLKQRERET